MKDDGQLEAGEINSWFAADEAIARCDPLTLDAPESAKQYLRNRLWKTLTEGIEIGRRLQKEKDRQKLCDILD